MIELGSYPDRTADERTTYEQTLDYFRSVVARKLDGLSEPDARRVQTDSGMSLLGTVNHLAGVELWWFVEVFAGHAPRYPWTEAEVEADPDCDWKPPQQQTVESVLAFYDRACAEARAAAASGSLDDIVTRPGRDHRVSLRWILVHMIEETARHAGHMDIMRESVDGITGD